MNWYHKPISEMLSAFGITPESGLNDAQIKESLAKNGKNELPQPEPTPKWLLFLQQFNDPIIYILIVAAILNAYVAEPKDAIVIGFVVLLNTIIGFVQEVRASAALKALQSMAAPTARVIRNSKHLTIPTTDVVVGDIVVLESGDRVPADCRLIDSNNLLVDESMLTGESFAIAKKYNAIVAENADLGDRITMVYSGTIVQKGRGLGIITAIGVNSEFGKISQKVLESEETESPLQHKIEQFGKVLSVTILTSVAVIFVVGWLRGNDAINMLLTSVGLAVSAIPEGLPVSVTITLSIGIYQMSKQNAILKRLAAVETLGSANVICSDKTGTLTKNQMTVTMLYVGGREYLVEGSGYEVAGKVIDEKGNKVNADYNQAMKFVADIGAMCTESKIAQIGKEWKITGDATEAALMIATEKLEFKAKGWNVDVDIPFESENQLMAVRATHGKNTYVFVKGAPERILERCVNAIDSDANIVNLKNEELSSEISNFSNRGLRVLAMAYAEIEDEAVTLDSLKNLTLVGFAGIQDAVREEVAQAVLECASAGVKVVMITGDHIETATAVGKAVNIGMEKTKPVALRGSELEKMSDEELFNKVLEIDVYARVAPEHKYRIVEQLQKQNKVVAMTGDGVNDAPALKKADIGIAMGTGSDVAKEAASMILMDDNFTSIVNAIRRGRIVLKNLQHILLYILATSFGGLLTIAMSVFVGFPLPILPAQLLWINLVTDGTSTFPLAFEKEHGNVMLAQPNKKDEPLVSRDIILRIVLVGILMMVGTLGVFYYAAAYLTPALANVDMFSPKEVAAVVDAAKQAQLPNPLSKAITMAFCTLAFFQIWNVQNSRSVERSLFFNLPFKNKQKLDKIGIFTNPILLGVMCFAIVMQVFSVAVPFMNTLLNTHPLTLQEWEIVVGIPFSIIIFVEAMKFIQASIRAK